MPPPSPSPVAATAASSNVAPSPPPWPAPSVRPGPPPTPAPLAHRRPNAWSDAPPPRPGSRPAPPHPMRRRRRQSRRRCLIRDAAANSRAPRRGHCGTSRAHRRCAATVDRDRHCEGRRHWRPTCRRMRRASRHRHHFIADREHRARSKSPRKSRGSGDHVDEAQVLAGELLPLGEEVRFADVGPQIVTIEKSALRRFCRPTGRGTVYTRPAAGSARRAVPFRHETRPVRVGFPEVVAVRAFAPRACPSPLAVHDIGVEVDQTQVLFGERLPLGEETRLVGVDPEVVAVGSMAPRPGPQPVIMADADKAQILARKRLPLGDEVRRVGVDPQIVRRPSLPPRCPNRAVGH